MDRVRNEEVRRRAGIERELGRVDQRIEMVWTQREWTSTLWLEGYRWLMK